MEIGNLLEIEVVYALPNEYFSLRLKLPFGSTVRDGIIKSGLLLKFRNLELDSIKVGIFSNLVTLDTKLNTEDRIEIYRPLIFSPTMARRLRAKNTSESVTPAKSISESSDIE